MIARASASPAAALDEVVKQLAASASCRGRGAGVRGEGGEWAAGAGRGRPTSITMQSSPRGPSVSKMS